MRLLDTTKSNVSLAFSLGVIFAVGLAAWRYVIVPFRTLPPKPIYANEGKPSPKQPAQRVAFKPLPPVPKPQAAPKLKNAVKPALEAKFRGKVNAGIGLVLRSEPSQGAAKIGGADYNAEVSILKESPDREWVYIRQESTKEEGWVRSGNLTRS